MSRRWEQLACDYAGDMPGVSARAVFNGPRTFRYLPERRWLAGPVMTWIMLNPSTAGAFTDDPTVRRCVSFARREGCGAVRIVNLFAFRATDPRELRTHPDPVGPCNDRFISEYAQGSMVVAAWGAGSALSQRGSSVGRRLAAAGTPLSCLGVTVSGHPRHPLYVHRDAPLTPWAPDGAR